MKITVERNGRTIELVIDNPELLESQAVKIFRLVNQAFDHAETGELLFGGEGSSDQHLSILERYYSDTLTPEDKEICRRHFRLNGGE